MAQIAAAVFGGTSILGFYAVQATTALVLFLAANTAFNGFPLLGSVLSRDRYAPKALQARGDRLVFSNGVIILGALAALLEVVFRANVNLLIQMYIIGVFISFTLGQSGMVVHWTRKLRQRETARVAYKIKRIRVVNFVGAVTTGTVLRHRVRHQVHPRRVDRLCGDAHPVVLHAHASTATTRPLTSR